MWDAERWAYLGRTARSCAWAALLILVVAMPSAPWGFWRLWAPSVLWWLQLGLFLLWVGLLLVAFGFHWRRILRFVIERPLIIGVLVLMYLLLFGLLGSGNGIPALFWHERARNRFLSAVSVSLLMSLILVTAYYLNPQRRRSVALFCLRLDGRRISWRRLHLLILAPASAYTRAQLPGDLDEEVGNQIAADLAARRRPGRRAIGSPLGDDDPAIGSPLVAEAPWDAAGPAVPEWLQRRFDRLDNITALRAYAGLLGFPLVLLASAPALFPLLFLYVPRQAPLTGRPPDQLDVGLDVRAYLLGLLIWCGGLLAGVLLFTLLIMLGRNINWALDRLTSEPEAGAGGPAPAPIRAATAHGRRLSAIRREREGLEDRVEQSLQRIAHLENHWGPQAAAEVQALQQEVERRQARIAELIMEEAPALNQVEARSVRTFHLVVVVVYVILYLVWTHIPTSFALCAVLGLVVVGLTPVPLPGAADGRANFWRRVVGAGAALVGASLMTLGLWAIRLGLDDGWFAFGALVALLVVLFAPWPLVRSDDPLKRALQVALLVGLLAFSSLDRYKLQFPGMEHLYPASLAGRLGMNGREPDPVLARLDDVSDRYVRGDLGAIQGTDGSRAELVNDRLALRRWHERVGGVDHKEQPKLVVVSVSGGGIRSAFWTATVLSTLEQSFDDVRRHKLVPLGPSGQSFRDHVRVIAGASGGMVGTAYYATIPPDRWRSIQSVETILPTDSLSLVASYMALREPVMALFPFVPPTDRGRVLDQSWTFPKGFGAQSCWKGLDSVPLADLAPLEREGSIPSLIFSPMMVEDGRVLLVSNLDLGYMVKRSGAMIQGDDAGPPAEHPYSLSGLEFRRLFPGATEFPLATAVRMSATFPLVSPAVSLPTSPPRRIVDAGYLENYGVRVAAAWIYENRAWLRDNTSGVVLIQVRDFLGQRDRTSIPGEAEAGDAGFFGRIGRSAQLLTSPVEGVLSARYSSSSYRNDGELEYLSGYFQQATGVPDFFTTLAFENSEEVALSWAITEAEVRRLRKAMGQRGGIGFDRTLGDVQRELFQLRDGVALPRVLADVEQRAWATARLEFLNDLLSNDLAIQLATAAIDRAQDEIKRGADPHAPQIQQAVADLNRLWTRNACLRTCRIEELKATLDAQDGKARAGGLSRAPRLDAAQIAEARRELESLRNFERLRRLLDWWKPRPKAPRPPA